MLTSPSLTFVFHCSHCPPDRALVLRTPRIDVHEDALLRAHLHAAHPKVRDVQGLGELLRHFKVEQNTEAQ
jgi:hypothetical protein